MTTLIDYFRRQLELEYETTKKFFAIVPFDKMDYKPHTKSMNMHDLVSHIADIPGWFDTVLNSDEMDMGKEPYVPHELKNREGLMAYAEECQQKALDALSPDKIDILEEHWVMKNGDMIFIDDPRTEVLASCLGQISHHRAQLGVYLRLLNIPIPGSYGPSADELD